MSDYEFDCFIELAQEVGADVFINAPCVNVTMPNGDFLCTPSTSTIEENMQDADLYLFGYVEAPAEEYTLAEYININY